MLCIQPTFDCCCRQRIPAIVQLLGHCNTCLQALLPDPGASSLPDQAPTSPCYPSGCAPADQQPSADPAASPSVLPAVHDLKAAQTASTSPDKLTSRATGVELNDAQPAHHVHMPEMVSASTEARDEGGLESLRSLVLEGSVGQALAEATIEVALAVLRGCDDTGQTSYISVHLSAYMAKNCMAPIMHIKTPHCHENAWQPGGLGKPGWCHAICPCDQHASCRYLLLLMQLPDCSHVIVLIVQELPGVLPNVQQHTVEGAQQSCAGPSPQDPEPHCPSLP